MAQTRKSSRRRYDNSLRREHAEATKERILEATVEVFGSGEFSVGKVAKVAGVSEPTIYRHFGSRDGLIEAFNPWFEQRFKHPGYPKTRDQARGLATPLFRFFDASGPFVRASLNHDTHELVAEGRQRRRERIIDMLVAGLPDADERRTRARAAVTAQLLSSRAWLRLREEFGLTTEEAGAATDWALGKLLDALEAEHGSAAVEDGDDDDGDADV